MILSHVRSSTPAAPRWCSRSSTPAAAFFLEETILSPFKASMPAAPPLVLQELDDGRRRFYIEEMIPLPRSEAPELLPACPCRRRRAPGGRAWAVGIELLRGERARPASRPGARARRARRRRALKHARCGLADVEHGATWAMPTREGAARPASSSGQRGRPPRRTRSTRVPRRSPTVWLTNTPRKGRSAPSGRYSASLADNSIPSTPQARRVHEAQMLASGPATSFVSVSVFSQNEHDLEAAASATCVTPPRRALRWPPVPTSSSTTAIAAYINLMDSRAAARMFCPMFADASGTAARADAVSLRFLIVDSALAIVEFRKSW